jgi:peptidoglycan hydrolase CwlO-like protein
VGGPAEHRDLKLLRSIIFPSPWGEVLLEQEAVMRGKVWAKRIIGAGAVVAALLTQATPSWGQSPEQPVGQQMDLATVGALLQKLQVQVQDLHAQVSDLKAEQQSAKAESAVLKKELEIAKAQLGAMAAPGSGGSAAQAVAAAPASIATTEERISRLEENQQLADSKIAEQSQTKVESGSKYRLRLTGIVLLNMFENRGTVENLDFPLLAENPQFQFLPSGGSFGGSIRQSQIGIQAFGPTVAGAQTSANIQFDFAGGFPEVPNGTSFGIMRLRTGTVRLDWPKTSFVAGQDTLFFVPNNPTSLATLAVPALAYSGTLWNWAPQVRIEHKVAVSESGSLLIQGGILDSFSGDTPPSTYYRVPTWGEKSAQPAYAARVSWTQDIHGQNLTLGAGGYYGRQAWGFRRHVDGWAGTVDASLPLGRKFELTTEFFRGRAIGGLGGGIGQSVLWQGSLVDPATDVYGLNSVGGWSQLKFKATSKLQFNGAYGLDNPYARELRLHGGNTNYYPVPLSKNESGFVNFIYQPRSDIVFSMEYRRIKTFTLDSNANVANVTSFSVGYIF